MSEKNYLGLLKIGVFASLITLFLAISGWLFPFVTSKQFVFNILIEVLLVFYLVFIIKFPAYRPKKSFISYGLLAYFVAIFLSLFVSVDFNLSFWGDLERMLGFFHLLHFLALYFIVITVFKTKKDYYWLFRAMILACLVVALMMIGSSSEKYSQSILGNRAYLAAFMLFGIFLSSLMISKSREWWQKSLYIITLPFFVLALIKADISGSHAGLLAGIFVSLFIFSVFNQNKKIKIIGLSALLVFLIFISSLFYFRSHSAFDGTYLGRALRDFSSENVTLNTRLISWKAAGKYLIDHPVNLIFGVGHGNYALIFDKYFDAKFYDYDRHATYFDRAHNNLVDIGATTGLIGLLSYLGLMVLLFCFLIKAYYKNKNESDSTVDIKGLNIYELSILVGFLSAYFVQNLAVFDSFSTYMYLMFFISFVYFLEISNTKKIEEIKINKRRDIKEEVLLLFFGAVFLFLIFSINIRGIKTAKKAVEGYTYLAKSEIISSHNSFKESFELNSVFVRDSRDAYINLMTSNFEVMLKEVPMDELEKIIEMLIYASDSNLNYNNNDSLMLFRSAKVYEIASRFYNKKGDEEIAASYNNIALQMIDLSIEASPERVPLYYFKSSVLLNFGEKEQAIETLNYAKSINPKMPDAFCQASNLHFHFEDIESFFENFSVCIENRGLVLMNFKPFIDGFEKYFYEKDDYLSLIRMYDILLEYHPENETWISNSTSIYYSLGDYDKAEKQAYMLLEIDSSYQAGIDLFLEQMSLEKNSNLREETN